MAEDKNQNAQKLKNALFQGVTLSEEQQKDLNKPISLPSGLSEANKKFLEDVMGKIEKGQIDLLKPSTLINKAFYDTFPQGVQGETDMSAVNLVAALREIKTLYDLKQTDSYQMENLVERVRVTKERLEEIAGDIYII